MAPPKVNIIVATYNRSNVLVHAIESVKCSTPTEWEMLVVGDACTDDTAEVVAGFHDTRIRFVNLEQPEARLGARRPRVRLISVLPFSSHHPDPRLLDGQCGSPQIKECVP